MLEFEDVKYEIEVLSTGEAFAMKYIDGVRVQGSHFYSEQEARDWATEKITEYREHVEESRG